MSYSGMSILVIWLVYLFTFLQVNMISPLLSTRDIDGLMESVFSSASTTDIGVP